MVKRAWELEAGEGCTERATDLGRRGRVRRGAGGAQMTSRDWALSAVFGQPSS